jgi:hypothetical protein
VAMGPGVVAKTLSRYGTDEQRARYLPEIARSTLTFALGYSEPEAGSLARSAGRRTHTPPRTYGSWHEPENWRIGPAASPSSWFRLTPPGSRCAQFR